MDTTKYQFERFEQKQHQERFEVPPFARLRPNGQLYLSRNAVALWPGVPLAVELLYDRAARVIGLRPANPNAPQVFRVSSSTTQHQFMINYRSFGRLHGITPEASTRYPVTEYDGILCIHLDPPKASRLTGVRSLAQELLDLWDQAERKLLHEPHDLEEHAKLVKRYRQAILQMTDKEPQR
jgi:hypothetical protein